MAISGERHECDCACDCHFECYAEQNRIKAYTIQESRQRNRSTPKKKREPSYRHSESLPSDPCPFVFHGSSSSRHVRPKLSVVRIDRRLCPCPCPPCHCLSLCLVPGIFPCLCLPCRGRHETKSSEASSSRPILPPNRVCWSLLAGHRLREGRPCLREEEAMDRTRFQTRTGPLVATILDRAIGGAPRLRDGANDSSCDSRGTLPRGASTSSLTGRETEIEIANDVSCSRSRSSGSNVDFDDSCRALPPIESWNASSCSSSSRARGSRPPCRADSCRVLSPHRRRLDEIVLHLSMPANSG